MGTFLGVSTVIAAGSLLAVGAPGIGHAAEPQRPASAVQHELITKLETKPVEYRENVKQALQAHMQAFGLILTLRAPHPENLQPHADALAWLAKAHEDLYPDGSQGPGTSASIWQQRDQFDTASKKTTAAAASSTCLPIRSRVSNPPTACT